MEHSPTVCVRGRIVQTKHKEERSGSRSHRTVIRRNLRRGHARISSANDLRPVIRSGHSSYNSSCDSPLCCDAILGFSKATFSRSIGWSPGSKSLARRDKTVQSRPPENKTATLASDVVAAAPVVPVITAPGGTGICCTRKRKDSVRRRRNCSTTPDCFVRRECSAGMARLKTPMPETCEC